MHSPKRIKITDVNPHLICVLCGGYYIDATTIIECLHSFCKSCIVRYLQKNKYCPICDVQVHKTAPLLNIRSDRTLQNIVYKLVPSLFKNEMERRVAFYEKYPGAMPLMPEQRGEITDSTPIFFPDELLIVCLEYQLDKTSEQGNVSWPKRYLHCPAAITVSHLVKLIRGKFGLSHVHHVSLFFKDDLLQDDITIMDIAYTYHCRRKIPIHLMYRILEFKKKTIRLMPPIPPDRLESMTQTEAMDDLQEEEQTKKTTELPTVDMPSHKKETLETENDVDEAKPTSAVSQELTTVVDVKDVKEIVEVKNNASTSNNIITGSSNTPESKVAVESAVTSESSEENKKVKPAENVEKKKEVAENVSTNEDSKEIKHKQSDVLPLEPGSVSEGEWKEVQLQISENGVMSVRNMKSSECSPTPAVEAPNCPISHPATVTQTNTVVTATKVSFASVPQTRNTEPIVSVSKVSKDQVKKEVNHTVVPCENKLSISRVTPLSAAPATTAGSIVAKGDVLNRIVSKLSPNETAIGNTGVTIRPVTKVYPGMKSVQERKSRATSNHLQSKYKSINQTPAWNPSIDRATMLTLKQNCDLNKPPRFFKMRNMPRFLGNPAEGVKPIYGGGPQEDSPPKQSPPRSPVKQPPPYTPRGQDKPPPPYTPRPAHTGCGGGGASYLPPNPYHLLYSGFPFSGASPELIRSMCASTAFHPSLPPSISMLYNNPSLQQPTPQRFQSSHDFKSVPATLPSIQRIPSSLSPKPPSLEDKKREQLPPASTSSSSSLSCSSGTLKSHSKPLEDKPPLISLPIPLPPPPPLQITDKTSTTLTNNNNTKESLLTSAANQHPLK